jgi:hypothetical protein
MVPVRRWHRRKNQELTQGCYRTPQVEGIGYTWSQREGTIDIIGKWIKLSSTQAARAYDSVRDTFSKIGVPTDEQSKAYIAMLRSTASLKSDVAAASIFDFSLAAEAAKELAQKK